MTSSKSRNTQQRLVILEELRKMSSHPTACELYERVRKRLPSISLGTVYRNLEILSRTDLIQKIEIGCGTSRFDGNGEKHYHIRCKGCDRVDDISIKQEPTIKKSLQNTRGYKVLGHRLELIGLCPDCRKGSGNSCRFPKLHQINHGKKETDERTRKDKDPS